MTKQRILIRGNSNGLGTLKEMSNILRLHKNKMKITLKFLLSPIRMVKKIKHPCWWWYGSRGTFIHVFDCANMYSQTVNQCVAVPQEDVTLSTSRIRHYYWAYTKRIFPPISETRVQPHSFLLYSLYPEIENHLDVPKENVVHLHNAVLHSI